MSFVYLLVSTSGSTYVGATVDLDRRLRQHNKEIKGGAHATGAKVAQGESWTRAAHVSGFPDWPAALQFEWRWKHISRKGCFKL
jgi:structure-specific endonuclease subunit SLX1